MIKPIRPIRRLPLLKIVEEEKVAPKRRKLPPDEYKDEIEPTNLVIDETRKIVLSVKRGGEDGLPMCDIRQFQTTELYTGFTKKGVNFPVEHLSYLIGLLIDVRSECEEKGLL